MRKGFKDQTFLKVKFFLNLSITSKSFVRSPSLFHIAKMKILSKSVNKEAELDKFMKSKAAVNFAQE